MSISIVDVTEQREYLVKMMDGFEIRTVVTRCIGRVSNWLRDTCDIPLSGTAVVGFNLKSRRSLIADLRNRIATVSLCVDDRCLIYQIGRSQCTAADFTDIKQFLAELGYTFAGVKINADVAKLLNDYGLDVGLMMDLNRDAFELSKEEWTWEAGLMALAERFFNTRIEKPACTCVTSSVPI